ncbi:MAG: hypothetical protein J2P32_01955, partial [Actinobacteria bacterium]|nr:hypothetical protein [Actinomycetota bacterium]
RRRVAITLVNRNPDQPEPAEIVLRDVTFTGSARIRTLTAERGRDSRALPDVEGAHLEEGSEPGGGAGLALTLPPRSMTVIEAETA